MKLDKIALYFVIAAVLIWVAMIFFASIALWPLGLLWLPCFAIAAFFIGTVVAQRLANKEDDYYEKNVHK